MASHPPMNYEQTLGALMAENPDLIVMTAENRAPIRNLPRTLGARFIDVGICEQTLVGAAAGLALRGRVPVVHALASFLTMRAFEFVRTDVGISGLPVKLVGFVPGFLSEANGPTHQAIEDISLMAGIPGMQVVCPADGEELAAALPAVIASPKPVYVRYNPLPSKVPHATPWVLGKAEVLAPGSTGGIGGVTLLTFGVLIAEAEKARLILEEQGVPVRLIDLRTLAPLDEEAIVAAARSTDLLVPIEDHFAHGGLYFRLAEILQRHGIACRIHSISLGTRWFKPALLAEVLAYEGFTGSRLAERIQEALQGV